MIKVMNVISDTNFGGAGRVVLNYLKNRNTEDFDVSVAVPKGSVLIDYIKETGAKIIEIDGMYDRSYAKEDIAPLIKAIKKENPDIIHSHGALSARIAGKKCGKKVIFTRHSVFDVTKDQIRFPKKFINKFINKKYTDKIIAVSPAAIDNLKQLGADTTGAEVVFNGVNKIKVATSEQADEMRKKYGIKRTDFVCSIIARLEEVKGHKYILQAAKMIKNKGINNIKIVIAGTGDYEEEVHKYAKELDVLDMFVLPGFITEIPTLLSITHLQLNASFGTEATSMAILEGFSIGVPTVASNFGGNPYVIKNNENGFIFEKNNANDLCDKILMLYNDLELLKELSDGAAKDYNTRFTSKVMAGNIEKIYREVLNGGKNNE